MRRILRSLLALTLLSAFVAPASAASPQGDAARSEHQQVVDFWTVERVRQAVPRDFVFDPASGRFLPAKPGNGKGRPGGGGGGGGGSTAVTGASWTDGGQVVDTTGKVLFELGTDANGNPQYWVCSASVVSEGVSGRSLVLTAAHCVYENEGAGEFAKNWMFIPNYDANAAALDTNGTFCDFTVNGCWTADALVLHDGFASAGGFNGNAILHDFAFAVLGNGGNGTPSLVESLGTQNVEFVDVSKNTAVHAFGYPHAAPYDGTDLVYCAGSVNFDNRLFKLTYKLDCDMTGGSSGGPWGTDFANGSGTLMSVNSYRYGSGGAMYGPKFNSTTQAVYDNALLTNADSIVGG